MNVPFRIEAALDWMTVTKTKTINPVKMIPDIPGVKLGEECKPPAHFDVAWSLIPAGKVAWQRQKHQTFYLNLTGQDLAKWRSAEIFDEWILAAVADKQLKATRIDYAIDIHGLGKVAHCHNHLEAGKRIGKPKPDTRIQNYGGRGETMYFGSTKSDQRIRIYDKAAEQNKLKEAWIRVELQARRERAASLVRDMHYLGLHAAGRQRIRDLVDFPSIRWYQEAVRGPQIELTKQEKKPHNTVKWLYNQVMLVFEKEYDEETLREMFGWLSNANIALRNANTPLDQEHG